MIFCFLWAAASLAPFFPISAPVIPISVLAFSFASHTAATPIRCLRD